MQQISSNSLINICKILQKNNVQYLIVGGIAVNFYGYSRMSMDSYGNQLPKQDFDFWYNPTYENYFNLLNALAELKQDVAQFKKEKSPQPLKSFFKFNLENFTLDLLRSIPGIEKFNNSYANKNLITINEVDICFISLEELIKNKFKIGRTKDLIDIENLKKINAKENNQ